ncbi:MAG TPA: PDZ domain-containing protein [Streptosporangiaceae bacterium]|nr:PDZ domain-containing protein [Streptosporangiaceae bacterium]
MRRLSRRNLTLAVAGAGIVVSLLVATLLPVPYVILSPGPTLNTLGQQGPHHQPLIQIEGHHSYPAPGHLNLVTVSYQGGPGDPFNIFTALQAWLDPHDAVVPQAVLFPAGQTQQQVSTQNTKDMATSQQTATAAAFCQLGIKFTMQDTVVAVLKGYPAAGLLRSGDVITAVDGTPVTCRTGAGALIRAHPPGTPITLTVQRDGAAESLTVKTADVSGHAVVGIDVAESYRGFPFNVKINVGDIGGPSAGLMFALGIVDKLTGRNLTAGKFIAGTGELVSADGTVGPIGGIQQKMAGARDAGATVFLTPAANCPDTAGAVPSGLRLVKVSSLAGAVSALQALASGRGVPGC